MAFIELRGVSKAYGPPDRRTEVLHDVNLEIERGEFVAIVGYSGAGKTTLVSLLSGLVTPDSGEVLLDGEPVLGPGAERGVVFQNYSLLPWLTVSENVALAVDRAFAEWPKEKRRAHTAKYVARVGLTAAAGKRPRELSGGMRQRVAVARALSTEPEVLLLDEPLSALDALTRAVLQDEIERIWRLSKRTVVLVTNDVDEGLLLADRIVPLGAGPRASLGPAANVSIARPRDRRKLNHEPEFKVLRAQIIKYLLATNARKRSGPKTSTPPLEAKGALEEYA